MAIVDAFTVKLLRDRIFSLAGQLANIINDYDEDDKKEVNRVVIGLFSLAKELLKLVKQLE